MGTGRDKRRFLAVTTTFASDLPLIFPVAFRTGFSLRGVTAYRFLRSGRAESGLFGVLVLVHLLPLWSFRYFPTTDGPAHLYNAWAANQLLTHAQHPFHQYLAFNPVPVPNYLTQGLLMGLLHLLPPWLAEKLVQSLFVVGLPWAVRYVVRAWQPAAGFLALLAFSFIYSAVFQYGFYNFCLSLVLLLVAIGYWRRHLHEPRVAARNVVGMGGLLLLLYFAHPLTYLLTGLVLGLLTLERAWTTPPGQRTQRLRTGLGVLLLACAPSLLLLGGYLQQPVAEQQPEGITVGAGKLLHDWLVLEPLRFMGSAEGTYRGLLAGLLLSLVAYAAWQHQRGGALRPGAAWALAALLVLGGYVLLPDALLGGSILRPRLGLLSYLLLLGLLSTVPYPRRLRQLVMGLSALLAVLLLGFRLGKYRTLVTGLQEYQSAAPYLRPGATIVSFTFASVRRMPNGRDYASYIDVFPHAASYLSVERQLLNLENYEAHTGYFPLVWQPGQAFLTERTTQPAQAAWATYPRAQWPEYVLVWGGNLPATPPAAARLLLGQLARHYVPCYQSATGLLELYRLRPPGRPAARAETR